MAILVNQLLVSRVSPVSFLDVLFELILWLLLVVCQDSEWFSMDFARSHLPDVVVVTDSLQVDRFVLERRRRGLHVPSHNQIREHQGVRSVLHESQFSSYSTDDEFGIRLQADLATSPVDSELLMLKVPILRGKGDSPVLSLRISIENHEGLELVVDVTVTIQ